MSPTSGMPPPSSLIPKAALPDAPHVDEIDTWLTADRKRKVAIVGVSQQQCRVWARDHNVAPIQMLIVDGPATLFGMSGDDCAIVLLKGWKKSKQMQDRIAVCQAGEVWILTDTGPAAAAAAEAPMLGGVSVGFGNSVIARDHVSGQSDVFLISGPNQSAVSITRLQAPGIIDLIQAWLEARPWTDPAAERADRIRAAVAAERDPFAKPGMTQ